MSRDIQQIRHQIQKLKAEHQELKALIESLNEQRWLTPEEEWKKKRYQKLKLAKKDAIIRLELLCQKVQNDKQKSNPARHLDGYGQSP